MTQIQALASEQSEFVGPDLHGVYTKLVRHVSAVYELLSLAPTSDPLGIGSLVGSPTTGLTAEQRSRITMHVQECMDMIVAVEKWNHHPPMVISKLPPPG